MSSDVGKGVVVLGGWGGDGADMLCLGSAAASGTPLSVEPCNGAAVDLAAGCPPRPARTISMKSYRAWYGNKALTRSIISRERREGGPGFP